MKKRLLSALLVLCMVLTLLPTGAFAAEGDVAQNVDTGTTYATLQDAADAAGTGNTEPVTIKLLQSIESDERVLTVGEDMNIVLDLGEYNITSSYDPYTISVESATKGTTNGKLTIIGTGTISNTSAGSTTIRNYGELTIGEEGKPGPTITRELTTNGAGNSAVKCEENSELIIYSGNLIGDKRSIQSWGTTTINGGTFEKTVQAWEWKVNDNLTYQSELTINGGEFTFVDEDDTDGVVPALSVHADGGGTAGEISVTGGAFADSTSLEAFLADGIDSAVIDGKTVVYTGNVVACVDGVNYTSLQDAANTAKTAGKQIKITLLSDIDGVNARVLTVSDDMDIVLDLNGYDITTKHDPYTISVESATKNTTNGKLTIIGTGTIENTSAGSTVIRNYGTLTIGEKDKDGPTITRGTTTNGAGNSAVKCEEASELIINSGNLIGDTRSIQSFGTTTINGGTFSRTVETWQWEEYTSAMEINNGIFEDEIIVATADGYEGSSITVYGGTFEEPVPADYWADGLVLVETTDGYGVAAGGKITFDVTPANATVEVKKGDTVVDATGTGDSAFYALTSGSYSYTVYASGYGTVSGNLAVENVDETIPVTLTRNSGTVTFEVTPADAGAKVEVMKDGAVVDATGALDNGEYTYTVSADGYDTETGSFTIAGDNLTIPVTLTQTQDESDSDPVIIAPVKPVEPTEPVDPVDPTEDVCDGGDDCVSAVFTDIDTSADYHDAIDYVVESGLMQGIGNNQFAPNVDMTRAMMWTILARLDGVDTEGGATWYEKSQAWAIENGFSDGTNPAEEISLEQLVTMLWRYVGSPEATESASDDVSEWAADAMAWAVENDIINGDGAVDPTGRVSRAELAKILRNCFAK